RGDEVTSLQRFLISQNLLAPDIATGFFGNKTRSAVMAFQRSHNLEAVGHVGRLTRARISALRFPIDRGGLVTPPETIPLPIYGGGGGGGGGGSPPPPRASCVLDGVTLSDGASQTFYSASTVAFPAICASYSQKRTCNNGTFSESNTYNRASCVVIGSDDTTAPTVAITEPVADATVSGTITISATASDPSSPSGQATSGMEGVQFKSSMSTVIFDDTTFPYETTLNTMILPNGPLTIYAVARDAAGNKATSTVRVVVSNKIFPCAAHLAPELCLVGSAAIPLGATKDVMLSETLNIQPMFIVPMTSCAVLSLPAYGQLRSAGSSITQIPWQGPCTFTYQPASGSVYNLDSITFSESIANQKIKGKVYLNIVPDNAAAPFRTKIIGSSFDPSTGMDDATLSNRDLYKNVFMNYYQLPGTQARIKVLLATNATDRFQEVYALLEAYAYRITGNSAHLQNAATLLEHAYNRQKVVGMEVDSTTIVRGIKAYHLIRTEPSLSASFHIKMKDFFLAIDASKSIDPNTVQYNAGTYVALIKESIDTLFPGEASSTERIADANKVWNSWWPYRSVIDVSDQYEFYTWSGIKTWMEITGKDSLWLDPLLKRRMESILQLTGPDGFYSESGDTHGLSNHHEALFEKLGVLYNDGRFTAAARKMFQWLARHIGVIRQQYSQIELNDIVLSAAEAYLSASAAPALAPLPGASALIYRAQQVITRDPVIQWRRLQKNVSVPDKLVLRSGPRPDSMMMVVNLAPPWSSHGHCENLAVTHFSSGQARLLSSTPYQIKGVDFQNGFQLRPKAIRDSYTDDTWHHVVATYGEIDSQSIMALYTDGLLIKTFPIKKEAFLKGTNVLQIGRPFAAGFTGQADSIGFYTRSLSKDDVRSIYLAGRHAVASLQRSPDVYWTGSSLTDQIQGLKMSAYLGASITNGVFNFATSSEYFQATSPIFNRTDQFTASLSMWFKTASPDPGMFLLANSGSYTLILNYARPHFTINNQYNYRHIAQDSKECFSSATDAPAVQAESPQTWPTGSYAVVTAPEYLGLGAEVSRKIIFLHSGWVLVRDLMTAKEDLGPTEFGPHWAVQTIKGEGGATWKRTSQEAYLVNFIGAPAQYLLQIPNGQQDLFIMTPGQELNVTYAAVDATKRVTQNTLLNKNRFRLSSWKDRDVRAGEAYTFNTLLRTTAPTTTAKAAIGDAVYTLNKDNAVILRLSSDVVVGMKERGGVLKDDTYETDADAFIVEGSHFVVINGTYLRIAGKEVGRFPGAGLHEGSLDD
ncbi:MAG: LamG-like jellyroll fold domain-containing protein, partial [Patescibacteria group bacterium]